jgi:hypothetical protein
MDGTNLAVVAIRPSPLVVHGPLARSDFASVAAWISLIEDAPIDDWNGTLGTAGVTAKLRPIGGDVTTSRPRRRRGHIRRGRRSAYQGP